MSFLVRVLLTIGVAIAGISYMVLVVPSLMTPPVTEGDLYGMFAVVGLALFLFVGRWLVSFGTPPQGPFG